MRFIFEIIDKSKRKIHLSEERWKHILKHSSMPNQIENIKNALTNPLTIRYHEEDSDVRFYFLEFKNNKPEERYLLVSVKYLNGEGFVITSFFTNRIEGLK